ncbi:hypothetical protein SAMN05428974_2983 [Sphingopyxis sp. YR583]|uniref:hypothetical protein n=1 Tax=Sphingopyxis sp. YR583 TaxID=1881047 RepID=UPI0008A7504A|nr:hypothetical protein [Sphingopyxis sp. YR583]SEH18745.1 hypothetical protein SAMN05428974_2983 [Sphingopyxis sp. YR583]
MSESVSPPGIDTPSPTLSARLRELAGYLAAPAAGRLTEEQRALSLGIARRLVVDVAARLDPAIDPGSLWEEWLRGGLPCATRLAGICFARAEEHRWREQSALRTSPPPILSEPDAANGEAPTVGAPLTEVGRAYLALQIADRRRFDALGNPALALADVDRDIFRALLLDIAAWRLAELSGDKRRAARLGDAVRDATEQQASETGMTHAGRVYSEILGTARPDAAAAAIARHNWPMVIALAASANGSTYDDMAMTLLTAESAALPSLLAPLRLDHAAIAPLEASLAMLPARAIASSGEAAR